MLDTLTGFAVVGLAIVVGYVLGRIDLLGPHGRYVLARLTFFVLSPFLLFVVLAEADAAMLFSALLPASALSAIAVMTLYVLIARLTWRRGIGETVIGALSAGQVNSNNIGIPISLYLLGSAAFPAPVILLQLIVFTPITLTLLDLATSEKGSSIWRILGRTASNPIVIGSVAGTLVSVSGVALPPIVMEPASLLANACVPVLLISYGLSLHGTRVLGPHGRRRDVLLASALKLLIMPLVGWVVAQFLFQLPPAEVLIVVVLAALPTAQNVFNYAQRYNVGEAISRDTIFLTTIGCVPVLLLATLLLG
ncbi:AEC family transporter [Microbacterium sp. NIBRBAC000506063]|uniref:AEC family transporter n=1 Tax=Microbacterium sp. NIBRBAC000506063 TaxID=2734618 RepID=UPI001BB5783C|nr:AEC family transporter [Microbacterium sp. NIBRBAC000506063]QTV79969.1 AEC family transporter [Microbacterium sp. NIBRBAC000506063]